MATAGTKPSRTPKIRSEIDGSVASFWAVDANVQQVGDKVEIDLASLRNGGEGFDNVVYGLMFLGGKQALRPAYDEADPAARAALISEAVSDWLLGNFETEGRSSETKRMFEAMIALRAEQGKDVGDAYRARLAEGLKDKGTRAALYEDVEFVRKFREVSGTSEASEAKAKSLFD